MRNTVKKGILVLMSMILVSNVFAQSLEEGIQMYKYGRFESAKRILIPMAETNALANYYYGLSELDLENVKGAKAIFQKFAEDPANLAGIARISIMENQVPEAMSMLTKIAGKAKKKDYFPLKYAADAITYTDGGDPNMAVEWYKKAMETERTGDLHIGLGDAYRKIQGGGGNAMTNYEYAETYPATQSLANYKKGNLWYAAKNYDSALVNYARSSELDAKNPLPFKALADGYYKVGNYKISKQNIEKYLELSDKTPDDQIQYANTLYLSKDYAGAIVKMNDLIGKGIERPYMYRVIGYSQYETKDYTNAARNMDLFFAKQDAKKVIPLDYIYLGKIQLKDSTKKSMANANFEKGIAMDTSSDKSSLLRGIAESFYEAEDYASSANWYKKLAESNYIGREGRDYWWAGYMYYYSDNYAVSEEMFKKYNEVNPTEPLGVLWMAKVTEKSKDKDFKNGAAKSLYNQWIGMVDQTDESKKKDLSRVYLYLAMVAYNSGDKAETKLMNDKLLSFDPANSTGLQIQKALPSMK